MLRCAAVRGGRRDRDRDGRVGAARDGRPRRAPTSRPPSSRRRTRASRGPLGSTPPGADAARRPRPRTEPSAVRRAGCTSAPPVPISRAASVQPRRSSSRADRLGPGRLAGRPDVLAERGQDDRLDLVDQLVGGSAVAPPRRRRRRRSGRRPPRPGHRSRRSGWSPAASPRRGARRPAIRRSRSAGRSGRDRRHPARAARRRGSTSSRHIGRISRGGPGSATMTRPSGAVDPPAGCRAVRVGAARRPTGCSQACLRLISGKGIPRRVPQLAQPASRAPGRRPASRRSRRDRLAGEVVRRRAQAAGRDDEVGPLERGREGLLDRRRGRPAGRSAGRRATPSVGQRTGRARRRSCRASRRRSARSRSTAPRRSARRRGASA